MIGKVTFDGGELVLEDDGTITCDNATLKRMYERELDVYRKDEYSPASGPFGVYFLHRTAKELGGKAEIVKLRQGDKNTIY